MSIIIDYNNQQSFGHVSDTMSIEPLEKKLEAFGWHVEVGDGHNIDFVIETLERSLQIDKPFALIANTVKGKGVSFMENRTKWHYSPPNDKEYEEAMKEIELRYALK
jgi:transketolase